MFHSYEFMFHVLPKLVVFSLVLVIFDRISHTKHPLTNLLTEFISKVALCLPNTNCRTHDLRQDYCEKKLRVWCGRALLIFTLTGSWSSINLFNSYVSQNTAVGHQNAIRRGQLLLLVFGLPLFQMRETVYSILKELSCFVKSLFNRPLFLVASFIRRTMFQCPFY